MDQVQDAGQLPSQPSLIDRHDQIRGAKLLQPLGGILVVTQRDDSRMDQPRVLHHGFEQAEGVERWIGKLHQDQVGKLDAQVIHGPRGIS